MEEATAQGGGFSESVERASLLPGPPLPRKVRHKRQKMVEEQEATLTRPQRESSISVNRFLIRINPSHDYPSQRVMCDAPASHCFLFPTSDKLQFPEFLGGSHHRLAHLGSWLP